MQRRKPPSSLPYGSAELYDAENLTKKSEPMFKLVMSIREATAGMESAEFEAAIYRYAAVLERNGKKQEGDRHKRLAMAVKSMRKAPAQPVRANAPTDLIAPPQKGSAVARVQ